MLSAGARYRSAPSVAARVLRRAACSSPSAAAGSFGGAGSLASRTVAVLAAPRAISSPCSSARVNAAPLSSLSSSLSAGSSDAAVARLLVPMARNISSASSDAPSGSSTSSRGSVSVANAAEAAQATELPPTPEQADVQVNLAKKKPARSNAALAATKSKRSSALERVLELQLAKVCENARDLGVNIPSVDASSAETISSDVTSESSSTSATASKSELGRAMPSTTPDAGVAEKARLPPKYQEATAVNLRPTSGRVHARHRREREEDIQQAAVMGDVEPSPRSARKGVRHGDADRTFRDVISHAVPLSEDPDLMSTRFVKRSANPSRFFIPDTTPLTPSTPTHPEPGRTLESVHPVTAQELLAVTRALTDTTLCTVRVPERLPSVGSGVVVLACPYRGAEIYLRSVAQGLAGEIGADFLRITNDDVFQRLSAEQVVKTKNIEDKLGGKRRIGSGIANLNSQFPVGALIKVINLSGGEEEGEDNGSSPGQQANNIPFPLVTERTLELVGSDDAVTGLDFHDPLPRAISTTISTS